MGVVKKSFPTAEVLADSGPFTPPESDRPAFDAAGRRVLYAPKAGGCAAVVNVDVQGDRAMLSVGVSLDLDRAVVFPYQLLVFRRTVLAFSPSERITVSPAVAEGLRMVLLEIVDSDALAEMLD